MMFLRFMRKILFLLLAFASQVALHSCATETSAVSSEIRVAHTAAKLTKIVSQFYSDHKHATKKLFYVSDIDDVLLEFDKMNPSAVDAKKKIIQLETSRKTANTKTEICKQIDNSILSAEASGYLVPIKGMIDHLNALDSAHYDILLLTQLTKNSAEHRKELLIENTLTALTKTNPIVQNGTSTGTVLLEDSINKNQSVFTNNMICAGFHSKANSLKAYLKLLFRLDATTTTDDQLAKQFNDTYGGLVYVDDSESQVNSIKALADELKINFIGIHFQENQKKMPIKPKKKSVAPANVEFAPTTNPENDAIPSIGTSYVEHDSISSEKSDSATSLDGEYQQTSPNSCKFKLNAKGLNSFNIQGTSVVCSTDYSPKQIGGD